MKNKVFCQALYKMIEELFGGKTAEKILLYLTAIGEGYSAEIAKAFQISATQVQRTVERLENADILVGNTIGRSRIYRLNDKWFLADKLKDLLDKALLFIPIDEQELYFCKRKKPRKKNKKI
ncbi:MAG: winged helix-turn-helix domain-containing protein [Ginsengibacter sp.]